MGVIATASHVLGIAGTQLAYMAARLGGRLLRTVLLTETPRDVTFVALDIVGFGGRATTDQARLRQRLFASVKVIKSALGTLVPYDVLDRGDGVLLLLPGRTDALRIVEEALPGLARRISAENRVAGDEGKMFLRCVIHWGHAQLDRWGWVGADVNLVFRLLDSRTLRKQLRRGDHLSMMTVALSARFYEKVRACEPDEQKLQNLIKSKWNDALSAHTFSAKEVKQTAYIASVSAP